MPIIIPGGVFVVAACQCSVVYESLTATMHIHESTPKVRATLYLPQDLLDEARNAVVHLAGNPVRLTLTKLAETALRSEIESLKQRYNDGEDFPQRSEDLKGGRPIAA